jgi:hypothetical protein
MHPKHRAGSLLLLGLLLAACAGTPASPPMGSSSPDPSPADTPGSTAIDASPSASPAASASAAIPTPIPTPTSKPDPSPSPTTAASGLPAGWHHELSCLDDGTGCQLHLYDAAGREQPGWPVTLAGGCWLDNLAVGTDGVAYTACRIDDEQVLFNAVDVSGATVLGWPIRATGYPRGVEVGRDGTVYFGTVNEGGDGILAIHAFGPDGNPRDGWPTTLPRTADFALAPDGTIVGWWYEDLRPGTADIQAARTKFTMIGSDGRTLAGWPVTAIGTASVPVITKDGGLFYTSGAGKVWGHDRSGNTIDGWPFPLPYWAPPELRPDGLLMFILGGWTAGDGTTSDSEVIVLTTAGRMASGWPYRTSASLDGVQCCIDCGSYYPRALSSDGTLYLAPWTEDRAEVVALDRRGQVVAGWPYRVPAGSRVTALEMGTAGRIVVTLRDGSAQAGYCGPDATRQITLTPAGDLAP